MKKKIIYGFGLVLLVAIAVIMKQQPNDPFVAQPLPELPVPPLRELAEERGISMGMFASLKYLRERPYSEIITTEFDQVIVDGEPNWKFEDHTLRPSKDDFDFAHMDQVFDFADQNDMPVRVQHLVWGEEKWLPEWLKNGNYSKDELKSILKDHISTVTNRYKGRVKEYSVVNEAFSRQLKTGGNTDWWGERLGQEYIDLAFIEARKNDPNAVLLLNDFGNESKGGISDAMYKYVKSALGRGVPIDGIGMQMHIDATNYPAKQEVIDNMKRFKKLGLKVYVTEFDVNIHFVEGNKQERYYKQAVVYSEMLDACLQAGTEICPSFSFLGMIDRQSWYNGIGLDSAEPLMFTDDYTPKPAFYAVRQALQNTD